jgi:hypothetical protein
MAVPDKCVILTFEKKSHKEYNTYKIDLITFLIKRSNLIWMEKTCCMW